MFVSITMTAKVANLTAKVAAHDNSKTKTILTTQGFKALDSSVFSKGN